MKSKKEVNQQIIQVINKIKLNKFKLNALLNLKFNKTNKQKEITYKKVTRPKRNCYKDANQ